MNQQDRREIEFARQQRRARAEEQAAPFLLPSMSQTQREIIITRFMLENARADIAAYNRRWGEAVEQMRSVDLANNAGTRRLKRLIEERKK